MTKRKSVEGFCLMLYRNEDTNYEEWIWNSRDGVTPFIIPDAKDGGEMKHVEWFRDVVAPFFVPSVGSRVFIDLTDTRSRILATRAADRAVADGSAFSREELIEMWVKSTVDGSPDILVVNSAMQGEFRNRHPPLRRYG